MYFKTFKATNIVFGALLESQQWLMDHGFSYGIISGPDPIGIKFGQHTIKPWREMTDSEHFNLDGILKSTGYRYEDVKLMLTNFVEDDQDLTIQEENRILSLQMAKEMESDLV